MESELKETTDRYNNIIKKGDHVCVIDHHEMKGKITGIRHYYYHHPGCVDDRGEGWDEEYTHILFFDSKEGKKYRYDRSYLEKVI